MKQLLLSIIVTMWQMPLSVYGQKLTEYLPQYKTNIAVVVCPGGSYCWLAKTTEGKNIARWLNSCGYAAYVLEYPTAGWAAYAFHSRLIFRGHQYPDQISSLENSLKLVREKGYSHVGAIGFSAGGHLVLNAAEYSPKDIAPDFVAAIYPVVTMSHPCVHRRSRRGLLGEYRWRNQAMRDSLSMEKHADRIQCPVFLINCADDPIVAKHNSELMDSALTSNKKQHFYKQYKHGGHGFGVNPRKAGNDAIVWKEEFITWLQEILK